MSWNNKEEMLRNVSLCHKSSPFITIPSKTVTLNWQWKDVVPLGHCHSVQENWRYSWVSKLFTNM